MNLYSRPGKWRKGFWPVISRSSLLPRKSTRKRLLSPGKGSCPPRYPHPGPQPGPRRPAGGGAGAALILVRAAGIPRIPVLDLKAGAVWAGRPGTQRGPSTYEVEGPRRGHPAGPPITRLPGCCPVAPPGRENQPGVPVSRRSAHPPGRSGFPARRRSGVPLISIFGGAEFLPLGTGRGKGLLP